MSDFFDILKSMFESFGQNITLDFVDFSWGIALFLFFAYMLIDALYAFWTLSVTGYNAVSAATTGLVVYLLLAFGTINYVENYLYVIPVAFGSWFGAYFMVRREKIKKDNKHPFLSSVMKLRFWK